MAYHSLCKSSHRSTAQPPHRRVLSVPFRSSAHRCGAARLRAETHSRTSRRRCSRRSNRSQRRCACCARSSHDGTRRRCRRSTSTGTMRGRTQGQTPLRWTIKIYRCRSPRSERGVRRRHICAGTGPSRATSEPGLGPPLPHPHPNWAHPFMTTPHLPPTWPCGGGGFGCCSDPPGRSGASVHDTPRVVQALSRRLQGPGGATRHICTGTGLTPATSAPGLGSPLPHLHRDWARPCHICTRTGLTPATSAPGPDWRKQPLPFLPEAQSQRCPEQTHARVRAHPMLLSAAAPVKQPRQDGARQSRCRCGRGEPSPGAIVAGVSQVPAQM
jgi:hypothetical protein